MARARFGGHAWAVVVVLAALSSVRCASTHGDEKADGASDAEDTDDEAGATGGKGAKGPECTVESVTVARASASSSTRGTKLEEGPLVVKSAGLLGGGTATLFVATDATCPLQAEGSVAVPLRSALSVPRGSVLCGDVDGNEDPVVLSWCGTR
jgi:hypothetical protein